MRIFLEVKHFILSDFLAQNLLFLKAKVCKNTFAANCCGVLINCRFWNYECKHNFAPYFSEFDI